MADAARLKETVYSIYIISKDGALLYQRDFDPAMSWISSNTRFLMGSIFYALHTVSSHEIGPVLSPSVSADPYAPPTAAAAAPAATRLPPNLVPLTTPNGIQTVEASNFKLQCHQTLTGLKFILITTPQYTAAETLMKQLVLLYTDYVLKNPFYVVNEPIRWYVLS